MTQQTELEWVRKACAYIGLREVKGVQHNPTIIKMLDEMGKLVMKPGRGGVMMRRLGADCLLGMSWRSQLVTLLKSGTAQKSGPVKNLPG